MSLRPLKIRFTNDGSIREKESSQKLSPQESKDQLASHKALSEKLKKMDKEGKDWRDEAHKEFVSKHADVMESDKSSSEKIKALKDKGIAPGVAKHQVETQEKTKAKSSSSSSGPDNRKRDKDGKFA